jgi:hypothetical protein
MRRLQSQRQWHAQRQRHHGDGRNREPDAGERRAERKVEADLQPVGERRAIGGHAFRQNHDRWRVCGWCAA